MQDDNYIDATEEAPALAGGRDVPERVIRTYAGDVASITGVTAQGAAVPPPVPAPQAAAQEDRDAILARLRAKAGAVRQPETAQAPPESAFDADRNASASVRDRYAPTASERLIEASPLEVPEAFVPPPAPVPAPAAPVKAPDISAGLHTYKNDFAEHIEDKGASAISVLATESDAPARKVTAAPVKKGGVALMLSGIAIVLLGGGALYAAYYFMQAANIIPTVVSAPSLIFVDEQQEITGTGRDLLAAFAEAAQKPLAAGAVRLVYATVSTTTADGITSSSPVSGGSLVAAMQLPAPDILLRSILPESMLGVVRNGEETRPFFILKVDSFERSFGGMLAWEPTLPGDLALLYPAYPAAVVSEPIASTTTPSSSVSSAQFLPAPSFKDEVVANHDVRTLRDASGRSLIMYGYWNQSTLVIARDAAAFTELMNRLATTRKQ
ncbi:MAG: hypothetical protein WDN10_03410 [bacterium]